MKEVFVQNLKQLHQLLPTLKKYQMIQFYCIHCNVLFAKSVYVLKKHNLQLLCKRCQTIQTNMQLYGVTNPTYLSDHNEKTKQTCLKKYGKENVSQVPIIIEKKKQTTFQHFGVENPSQSPIVKDRKRATCLLHHGVVNPVYMANHMEKVIKTSLVKYNTTHPKKSVKVQEKWRKTWGRRTLEDFRNTRVTAFKRYTYGGQSFDSSWELAVWIWAHDMGKLIKREPVSFKYEFNHVQHIYVPDFDIDGQLIEVKGSQFFNKQGFMINPYDSTQNEKYEAKHQCGLQNGVQFWSEKELKPILVYMKKMHGVHWADIFLIT